MFNDSSVDVAERMAKARYFIVMKTFDEFTGLLLLYNIPK
jgi:hypothetical protein